jgi:hydroxymethylpyrimidine pyrophosphatase-like HAD family hydrolase
MTAIAKHLGIPSENILAAGDHCNDLPMLDSQHARGIVCPANAVDAVKEKVSRHGGYVAKTNAALGVLEGWNHFFPHPPCAAS